MADNDQELLDWAGRQTLTVPDPSPGVQKYDQTLLDWGSKQKTDLDAATQYQQFKDETKNNFGIDLDEEENFTRRMAGQHRSQIRPVETGIFGISDESAYGITPTNKSSLYLKYVKEFKKKFGVIPQNTNQADLYQKVISGEDQVNPEGMPPELALAWQHANKYAGEDFKSGGRGPFASLLPHLDVERQYQKEFGQPMPKELVAKYPEFRKAFQNAIILAHPANQAMGDPGALAIPENEREMTLSALSTILGQTRPRQAEGLMGRFAESYVQGAADVARPYFNAATKPEDSAEMFRRQVEAVREGADPMIDPNAAWYSPQRLLPEVARALPSVQLASGIGTAAGNIFAPVGVASGMTGAPILGNALGRVGSAASFAPNTAMESYYANVKDLGPDKASQLARQNAVLQTAIYAAWPTALQGKLTSNPAYRNALDKIVMNTVNVLPTVGVANLAESLNTEAMKAAADLPDREGFLKAFATAAEKTADQAPSLLLLTAAHAPGEVAEQIRDTKAAQQATIEGWKKAVLISDVQRSVEHPDAAKRFAETDPTAAWELSANDKPSRHDWEDAGLPSVRGIGQNQRDAFVANLRDHIKEQISDPAAAQWWTENHPIEADLLSEQKEPKADDFQNLGLPNHPAIDQETRNAFADNVRQHMADQEFSDFQKHVDEFNGDVGQRLEDQFQQGQTDDQRRIAARKTGSAAFGNFMADLRDRFVKLPTQPGNAGKIESGQKSDEKAIARGAYENPSVAVAWAMANPDEAAKMAAADEPNEKMFAGIFPGVKASDQQRQAFFDAVKQFHAEPTDKLQTYGEILAGNGGWRDVPPLESVPDHPGVESIDTVMGRKVRFLNDQGEPIDGTTTSSAPGPRAAKNQNAQNAKGKKGKAPKAKGPQVAPEPVAEPVPASDANAQQPVNAPGPVPAERSVDGAEAAQGQGTVQTDVAPPAPPESKTPNWDKWGETNPEHRNQFIDKDGNFDSTAAQLLLRGKVSTKKPDENELKEELAASFLGTEKHIPRPPVVETINAEQDSQAGPDNGSSSPQPEVREEGGNPPEGSAGVQPGGQGDGNPPEEGPQGVQAGLTGDALIEDIARRAIENGENINTRLKNEGYKIGSKDFREIRDRVIAVETKLREEVNAKLPENLARRAAQGENVERPEGISPERWAAMVKQMSLRAGQPDTIPEGESSHEETQAAATAQDDAGPTAGSRPARQPLSALGENGRSGSLVLNDGTTHDVQYHAVESDSILPSHNARRNFVKNESAYPNERPYEDPVRGAAERAKVIGIAQADPKKLSLLTSDTISPDDGPPITTPDGTVLGGNGRAMGTQLAYSNGGEAAQRVKQTMVDAAGKFGLDPAKIEGMKEPIIVRSIVHVDARSDWSTVLNESLATGRSQAVIAVSRGKKVSDNTAAMVSSFFAPDEDGKFPTLSEVLSSKARAAKIVDSLRNDGAWSPQDFERFTDPKTRDLNDEGKASIEKILLGRIVPDASLIDTLTPGVKQRLLTAVGPLTRGLGDATHGDDLAGILHDALESFPGYKESARPAVQYFLEQGSMFDFPGKGDNAVAALVKGLDEMGPRKFSNAITEVIQQLGVETGEKQTSMFGPTAAADDARAAILDVFGDPAGPKILGSVMPSLITVPDNLISQVGQGLKEVTRLFTNNHLPNLTKTGAEVRDAAETHAGALIAAKPIAQDLLNKVFETPTRDPGLVSKMGKTLTADNILGIYDGYKQAAQDANDRALEARKKIVKLQASLKQPGITPKDERAINREIVKQEKIDKQQQAIARREEGRASLIGQAHNLNDLAKTVQMALLDPKVAKAIENWKKVVNPYMDQLYNEVKRVDPATPRDSRGRYTDARINLLTNDRAEAWKKFSTNTTTTKAPSEVPEPNAGSYRNPDVKRDTYMRRATGTGEYSTDLETGLLAALAPRYNQATKIKLYDALIKAGVAAEEPAKPHPLAPRPDFTPPEGYVRMPMKLPETDELTDTTHITDRGLWVRPDLVNEIRGVLNTDMRGNPSVILRGLTRIQMIGFMDLTSHAINIERGISNALGATSAGKDLLRKLPGVGLADTSVRLAMKAHDLAFGDNATKMRLQEQMAKLAKIGALRPEYNADETGGILQKGGKFLHQMDTAARLTLDDFFQNLVDRGMAKDTEGNRRDFINQIGQYNRRVMSDFEKKMRDWGASPFIVAGKTMTQLAIRTMIGSPGFEAASGAAEAQARLLGLSKLATIPLAAAIANYLLHGNAAGRPGTMLGQIDLGDDKDGKRRTIDLWQLEGIKRGMRATGVAAVSEGLQSGKNMNQIIGQAAVDMMRTVMHPIVGPGLGFLSKVAGAQLDLRGNFEGRGIPKTGEDLMANAKAAAQAQNPLLYALATGGGGPGFTQQPMASLGVTSQRPAQDAAQTIAQERYMKHAGAGGMNDKEKAQLEEKQSLLRTFKKDTTSGNQAIGKALKAGEISQRQAANIRERAKEGDFAWKVKHLSASDLADVWNAPATAGEKGDLIKVINRKLAGKLDGQDRKLLTGLRDSYRSARVPAVVAE